MGGDRDGRRGHPLKIGHFVSNFWGSLHPAQLPHAEERWSQGSVAGTCRQPKSSARGASALSRRAGVRLGQGLGRAGTVPVSGVCPLPSTGLVHLSGLQCQTHGQATDGHHLSGASQRAACRGFPTSACGGALGVVRYARRRASGARVGTLGAANWCITGTRQAPWVYQGGDSLVRLLHKRSAATKMAAQANSLISSVAYSTPSPGSACRANAS